MKILKIKNILTILSITFISFYTFAQEKFNIEISGSDYVDKEIVFSLIEDNANLSNDELINYISKSLYNTGNFKNIKISIIENKISLFLQENPKINEIKFNNNERFKDTQFLEIYNDLIKTNTYNDKSVENYISYIQDMYKSFGYNQIQIDYEINYIQDSNFVDLIFEFNEGKISKIGKVYFIGNENFNNSTLIDLISSKPKRDLLFFLRKNFKMYELSQDELNIKEFYNNNGFKDVDIKVETEYFSNKNHFNIYFYINEGKKHLFNEINLLVSIDDFSDSHKDELTTLLTDYKKSNLQDKTYNFSHVNIIKDKMTQYMFDNGNSFFEIKILEKTDDNLVSILYEFKNTAPKYVNFINIYGNTRTLDKVIRRELIFAEGDPINDISISESINNIKKLGFFKTVTIDEVELDNNLIDLSINVEEQTSGDFNIGLAFGTLEGATFVSQLTQNNIAGTGRAVSLAINTSDKNKLYSFNIREPRVINKVNLNYGISYQELDYSKSSYYDLDKLDFNLGFDFNITNKINNKISLLYELNDYGITDTSKVSSTILDSSGSNAIIKIKNDISYNNLNSFIRPSSGHAYSFSSVLSPITNSNDGYIKNTINLRKYFSLNKSIVSIQTQIGNITSLQDDVVTDSDKFSTGGSWLRGFDSRGVGPRNSSSSYVGGNNLFVTKLDYSKPIFSKSDNPLDFFVFTDFGTVYGNKSDPSNANESIRSSAGYGLRFYSPIGPIGLTWGHVIKSESYDKKRDFLFSIGNLH